MAYRPTEMDTRFETFDAENPIVYETMRTLALDWVRRTNRRIGAQALLEVCRWNLELEIESEEEAKINNDFGAYFARKLAILEPRLKTAFEFRGSMADPWAIELIRRLEAGEM